MPWSLFVPDLIMFIHHFTCPPYTVDHLICHTLRPHTEGTQRPHLEAIMELHFEPLEVHHNKLKQRPSFVVQQRHMNFTPTLRDVATCLSVLV